MGPRSHYLLHQKWRITQKCCYRRRNIDIIKNHNFLCHQYVVQLIKHKVNACMQCYIFSVDQLCQQQVNTDIKHEHKIKTSVCWCQWVYIHHMSLPNVNKHTSVSNPCLFVCFPTGISFLSHKHHQLHIPAKKVCVLIAI
jgi:hypothetical protein